MKAVIRIMLCVLISVSLLSLEGCKKKTNEPTPPAAPGPNTPAAPAPAPQ